MTSSWPAASDLPPPERAAYFLDFDGTLVDIAPAPELVRVEPGLAESLIRLRALCGDALAIVTGRPIAQVDAFLPGVPFAIAGEHGTALRTSPGAEVVELRFPAMPVSWLSAVHALASSHPGAMVEPKRHGFALHYRAAPHAGQALHAELTALLAEAPGQYDLLAAKMAWEVRPRGTDKGSAVRALIQHRPFLGRLPVFIGDDVTDEDGIAAAIELGGAGLRVAEAFGDPDGVREWLRKQSFFDKKDQKTFTL